MHVKKKKSIKELETELEEFIANSGQSEDDIHNNVNDYRTLKRKIDNGSFPKLILFVIHKHLFVICVCVAHFFRSKINFVGQHKPHSRLKKNLHRIHK